MNCFVDEMQSSVLWFILHGNDKSDYYYYYWQCNACFDDDQSYHLNND